MYITIHVTFEAIRLDIHTLNPAMTLYLCDRGIFGQMGG